MLGPRSLKDPTLCSKSACSAARHSQRMLFAMDLLSFCTICNTFSGRDYHNKLVSLPCLMNTLEYPAAPMNAAHQPSRQCPIGNDAEERVLPRYSLLIGRQSSHCRRTQSDDKVAETNNFLSSQREFLSLPALSESGAAPFSHFQHFLLLHAQLLFGIDTRLLPILDRSASNHIGRRSNITCTSQ